VYKTPEKLIDPIIDLLKRVELLEKEIKLLKILNNKNKL
jgi:hypothetical protein